MHVAMTAIFDPSTMDGRLRVLEDQVVHRIAAVPGPAVPASLVAGALPAQPPDLGGGPRLRPRLPHPSDRSPEPGRPPRAGRDGRPDRQHAAGPEPAPLGALRRRGPGRRQHRGGHQDAPLRGRRGVGRRADGEPVRPRAGRARPRPSAAPGARADPVRRRDAAACAHVARPAHGRHRAPPRHHAEDRLRPRVTPPRPRRRRRRRAPDRPAHAVERADHRRIAACRSPGSSSRTSRRSRTRWAARSTT